MPKTMKLEKGTQYRVINPCRLCWWVPSGPWSHTGKSHELKINDIITFVGSGYSGGSDVIHENKFRLENVVEYAAISCSYWGSTLEGYLEEV